MYVPHSHFFRSPFSEALTPLGGVCSATKGKSRRGHADPSLEVLTSSPFHLPSEFSVAKLLPKTVNFSHYRFPAQGHSYIEIPHEAFQSHGGCPRPSGGGGRRGMRCGLPRGPLPWEGRDWAPG